MIEIRNETNNPIFVKVIHTKLGGNTYIYVYDKDQDGAEEVPSNYYLQPTVEESLV